MKHPILLGTLFLLATNTVNAQSQLNAIGVDIGFGSMDYNSSITGTDDDNTDVSWSGSLFLDQGFTPNLGVSFGLHTGNGTSVKTKEIGVASESEGDLGYQAISLSGIGYFFFSPVNRLYGSAGINYNTVELKSNSTTFLDKDGIGLILRAGWEHKFTDNLSTTLGIQRLSLEKVDLSTTNLGLKMRF